MILAAHPNAKINFERLDLGSFASVTDFANRFARTHSSLDLLVNNAGIMTPPKRQITADGFELQFGTNHPGHFALTAQLLPFLQRGRQPRVITVSSLAHRAGAIRFEDLQWERRYKPFAAYCQSKLANLMFAFELQRHSDANGWGLMSNAAHPGYARTELIQNGQGKKHLLNSLLGPFSSHSPADGALPTLFAATSPKARKGGYYGPNGSYEMKGSVAEAFVAPQTADFAGESFCAASDPGQHVISGFSSKLTQLVLLTDLRAESRPAVEFAIDLTRLFTARFHLVSSAFSRFDNRFKVNRPSASKTSRSNDRQVHRGIS
jgi:NAD(P)-dependent dehydrogenase (short-subunit alcohol dehydrogenase family)